MYKITFMQKCAVTEDKNITNCAVSAPNFQFVIMCKDICPQIFWGSTQMSVHKFSATQL